MEKAFIDVISGGQTTSQSIEKKKSLPACPKFFIVFIYEGT